MDPDKEVLDSEPKNPYDVDTSFIERRKLLGRHPRGNRKLIRAINRSAVLNTVKREGPISRTEVAQITGLSAATVSGITADLIASNLIFEKEAGDSSGGRRPILLALNPRGGFVIGLKLAEKNVIAALTDLEATVIAKDNCPLENHAIQAALDCIVKSVRTLLKKSAIREDLLIGVGIGLAGIIDGESGILRHSPIFGWRDIPLKSILQKRLEVPVYVDNDVNTLTLTEQWFGAGQGVDHFLTVTIGRGIGLGIVLHGKLYHGVHGGAGEFGHTVVDPEGELCECGKRGCLETMVADPWLVRRAEKASQEQRLPAIIKDVEGLVETAREGHPEAISIFAAAGDALAQGVANLINVLSPELIIISGEGVRAGDLLFEPMYAAIDKYVMPGLVEDTEVRIDLWDDDAWARGAAGLVLRVLFESPIHHDLERITA
jgi:predicted NBD/HSP70 family sugar kinase